MFMPVMVIVVMVVVMAMMVVMVMLVLVNRHHLGHVLTKQMGKFRITGNGLWRARTTNMMVKTDHLLLES